MNDDIVKPVTSPKDLVREIVDSMPDSATFIELVDEIRFAVTLEASEQDIRAGRFITQEELKERFRRKRQLRTSNERP